MGETRQQGLCVTGIGKEHERSPSMTGNTVASAQAHT